MAAPSGGKAGRCRVQDMLLQSGPAYSEPSEQHTVSVVLRYRGRWACRLFGYPRVILLNPRGRAIPFVYSHGGDQVVTSRKPFRFTLRPGHVTFFLLNKNVCTGRERTHAVRLRAALPGSLDTRSMRISDKFPYLDYCGRSDFDGVVVVSPLVPNLDDAQQTH